MAAGARDRAHQNVLEEARQSLFVVSALRLHAAGPRELRVQVQRYARSRDADVLQIRQAVVVQD